MIPQDTIPRNRLALLGSGCFVMPDPWDAGSARALEQLGFQALATTSAGSAWTLGRADNQITLSQALEHLRSIVAAVKVPVSADFEGGYAVDPDDVAENVKHVATTGIAGLSIEDSTGDEANPLHNFDLAVERVRNARAHGMGRIPAGSQRDCGRRDVFAVRAAAECRCTVSRSIGFVYSRDPSCA